MQTIFNKMPNDCNDNHEKIENQQALNKITKKNNKNPTINS